VLLDRLLDNQGGMFDDLVSSGVSIIVVVGFEIIQVSKAKGEQRAGIDPFLQHGFDGYSAGKTGQGTGIQVHFFQALQPFAHLGEGPRELSQFILIPDIGRIVESAFGNLLGGVFQSEDGLGTGPLGLGGQGRGPGPRRQGRRCYCSTSSTRLFLALPSSVLLEATGASGPTPYPFSRPASAL